MSVQRKVENNLKMFFTQLIIGTILVCVTVVIHAFALNYLMQKLESGGARSYHVSGQYWKVLMLIATVLGVFLAHVLQIWVWAVFYLSVDALETIEESLYFSTSSYTTVGFGDVVLDRDWRLISSFQSANGFMLFGWSTAFIFEIMAKLYRRDQIRITEER